MINKEKAFVLLEGFKAEYDFAGKPPADITEFIKCLGWEEIGKGKNRSLVLWNGEHLFSDFLEKWEFDRDISKEDGTPISKEYLKNVGLALKYEYAWDAVAAILFLQSDLPRELLLESSNDLECSIILSKERYFKQAFQVLRNYCEVCVSIMYFQRNKGMYIAWLNDMETYHFPEYREMLNVLTGYLEEREKDYLKKCYRRLNHSVHSKRKRLNMNIERLEGEVRSFYCENTSEWSEEFMSIAKFMLELYVRKYL